MRISKELQTGKAGEYLVCADLILKGYVAFLSEQGLPYDVLLDNGKKLLRIQVKTTSGTRKVQQRVGESQAYIFNVKRHGANNAKRYGINEIDLFALVCLDTMKIGYLKTTDMPETINIRADHLKGTHYDEKAIIDYEEVLKLKGTMSQTAIAKQLNMQIATVNRMCQDGYEPHKTNARYFSDFIRGKEWFENLW